MRLVKSLTAACVLIALLIIVGCTNGGSSSTGTKVTGTVRDSAGVAIVGATLHAGSVVATSLADGTFSLENVIPANTIIIEVKGPSGAKTYLATQDTVTLVKGQEVIVNFTLQEVGHTAIAVNLTAQAIVNDDRTDALNAKVVIPANSLVTSTGGAVTVADIAITTVLPKDNNFTDTFPGLFVGNGAPGTVGDTPVVSYGYVDVTATSDGKELQLAAGKTAEITFPIDPNTDPGAGPIEMWYLDEDTGKWVYEGMAVRDTTVVPNVFKGTVSHFSPHNLDRPLTNQKSVAVTVIDGDTGIGAPGAIVTLKSSAAGAPAWEARQTTAANGVTLFTTIPPGNLSASATYSNRTAQASGWDPDTSTMTIYLPSPPGPVEVTVLDQNNNLVNGADVYLNLFGTGGNTTATKKTTTVTGKVTFPNVTGTSLMFQAVKVSTFQVQMYSGPMARKVTIKFSAPPVKSEIVITVIDTDGTTPVPNAVVKLGLWSEGQQGGSSIIPLLSGTTNAQGVVTFAQAPEMFLIAESTVGTKKGSAWLNSATPTPPATNRTGTIFLGN